MYKLLKENTNLSCKDVSDLWDYIAYLAHEIRTPLNSIRGNLDILKTEEGPKSRYLNNAILSTEYLVRLVDSALTIAEIKNDSSVMSVEAVTLEELFEYPKGILEWAADEKNIELQFLFGKTVYKYLYLNRTAIQQIIINLISNSIKYTNEGGKVLCCITETYLEEKRIKLFLEVSDTGIGMEEGFALYAWDKFTREGRSSEAAGSGLGMTFTKQLVELLNGSIELETQSGCGTKVVVELEADGDDVLYDMERHVKEQGDREGTHEEAWENMNSYTLPKRALVAEDESASMDVICKYLEKLGIEAEKAYDGDEVIKLFKRSGENYYDVLLLDINLPEQSGIEALRKIRKLDRTDSGVPVIIMTADVPDRHKAGMLSGEISGYIIKPYCLEDIRSALSQCRK